MLTEPTADIYGPRLGLLKLLLVAGAVSVWIYAALFALVGCYIPMIIELVYGTFTVGNAVYIYRTGRGYRFTTISHVVLVLLVTGSVSLAAGGLRESGVFLFWGLISPVAALVFLGVGPAILAGGGYFLLAGFLSAMHVDHSVFVPLPVHLQSFFIAANAAGGASLVMLTLLYFIRRLDRERTRRERYHIELMRQQRLESLGTLAGGIAHDFNNILMALMGNMAILRQSVERDPQALERIACAEQAIKKAAGLTSQLLTFSKGGNPVAASTSIAQLVQETAGFALHGSNCSCTFDIPDDLWPVSGDPGQLCQVVQNLILNASQAMPGGGAIAVRCTNVLDAQVESLKSDKEYVCIQIHDQGIGITPENIEKIFDPYFTTRAKGSGLGLASAYSIVRNHSGAITVDSRPGRGSTFSVYLPAADHADPEHSRLAPLTPMQARSLLVMDDDPAVLDALTSMLHELGHEVVTATNGQQLIDILADGHSRPPYDLFILDLTIKGGMGGVETASHILKQIPDACIIASSGYSNAPVMSQPGAFGFADTLQKPYDLRRLQSVLNRNLPT